MELARADVAGVVLHLLRATEIPGGVGVGGGDDVPAGAAARDVVERGEAAGDVVGRVEGCRGGGDESDALGDGGQRGQERERLEAGYGVAALQRVNRHVEHGQVVGHEEEVELRRLELLGEAPEVGEVEVGVREGAGIAPRTGVDGNRAHEGAEVELAGSAHRRVSPGWLRMLVRPARRRHRRRASFR